MKLRVTFKDPDGASESIHQAVERSVRELGLTDDAEIEAVLESRLEKVNTKLERWVRYGEYLTVEFDLDAMTARVVENRT